MLMNTSSHLHPDTGMIGGGYHCHGGRTGVGIRAELPVEELKEAWVNCVLVYYTTVDKAA